MSIKTKKAIEYLKQPFIALKDVSSITLCAVLLALAVAISFFSFYITSAIKISFTFLFIAIIAMKFGPVIAGICAAMVDIIQYFIHPVGAFQPLLTLTSLLMGVVYGIFLYKDKINIWRIIVSRFIIYIFISTFLNSYFISMLYGKVFKEFLITRFIKNSILFPIEIILTVFVLNLYIQIEHRLKGR